MRGEGDCWFAVNAHPTLFLCICSLVALGGCGGKVADTWAPPPDPDATPGTYCGAVTCSAQSACILSGNGGPRACGLPVTGPGGVSVCPNCIFASCDGPEDCTQGTTCTLRRDGAALLCDALPADACSSAIPSLACHSNADCPACTPTCVAASVTLPGSTDALSYGLCAPVSP
jgi:hypothetical protein